MADPQFDGIVIGSGYNGLTLAGYMAKAGLKVAVLERRLSSGGATITQEVTRPGFYHNIHANFIWSYGPPYQDFELHRYGVKLMTMELERAYLFDDGTVLKTYTGDPYRTYKHFCEVVGKADADTLEDIYHRFLTQVEEEFYATPRPERGEGLPDSDKREYQRFCAMTGRQVVNELFQSDKLKTFISMSAVVRGNTDFYPGTGDFFLRYAASPRMSIFRGGTTQLAHGLAAFVHAHGGAILNGCHVEKILTEGDRATGVRVSDGSVFRASKFIASEADPPQTFLKMIGEEHLPALIVQRVKNWEIENYNALFSLHLASEVAPDYSRRYPEEVNRALCVFWGVDSTKELDLHWKQIGQGQMPDKPGGDSCCHTVIDPSYAPPGKHTLLFWQVGPPAGKLANGKSYEDIRWSYFEHCLNAWRRYAPNLTEDKVLGKYCYTPEDIAVRLINMLGGGCRQGSYGNGQWYWGRPFPECSNYRTPIPNVYLCGSSCHPGGSINFGPGYNCANAIAEDLKIKKWWPPYRVMGKPVVSKKPL